MQNNYGNPGYTDDRSVGQRDADGSLFGRRNKTAEDAEYAGFWVRMAAYCIDLVIVGIGLLFVKLIIGIVSLSAGDVIHAQILFHYTLKDIILYVLQAVYFILLTYFTGTTPGKRLMNLRVVNADGRERLDFVNILYRETVGRFLCGLSLGIGYIMAGVDREKRGLHDMLCDTRVIYGKKIKVLPKYQVPVNYPPIPPAPPVPPAPMPPYGEPWRGGMPGGGMPDGGFGPMGANPGDVIPPQGGKPCGGNGEGLPEGTSTTADKNVPDNEIGSEPVPMHEDSSEDGSGLES